MRSDIFVRLNAILMGIGAAFSFTFDKINLFTLFYCKTIDNLARSVYNYKLAACTFKNM